LTVCFYRLTDSNELIIDFKALTDLPTPVNLANHAYFNLAGHEAGSQQLYNHRVQLYADRYTPVDDEKIPTGELASVNGTAFDLRSETRLGDVIHSIPGGGYDHNFVAGHSGRKSYHTNLPLVAEFWHPPSGRLMKVFSNQPGFQLYTGNVLPADDSLLGKNGRFYHTHDGFCVETQNFPDAINQVLCGASITFFF
jgi:aldose 1-epimerase